MRLNGESDNPWSADLILPKTHKTGCIKNYIHKKLTGNPNQIKNSKDFDSKMRQFTSERGDFFLEIGFFCSKAMFGRVSNQFFKTGLDEARSKL